MNTTSDLKLLQNQSDERKTTIEKNLGLVHACAHKFKGKGIEYEDLYGAGCVGLIKATDGFDKNRGVMFSTYAVPVILGEMKRLFRDGGTIKVSRSLKEISLRATREREFFLKKYGREPTITELSEIMEIDQDKIIEAITASAHPVSLTYGEDGEQIDLPTDSPEELLSERISLAQVLDKLPEEERELIRLRYFNYETQSQTAQKLGMTQVQVSRKEKKILTKLREMLI